MRIASGIAPAEPIEPLGALDSPKHSVVPPRKKRRAKRIARNLICPICAERYVRTPKHRAYNDDPHKGCMSMARARPQIEVPRAQVTPSQPRATQTAKSPWTPEEDDIVRQAAGTLTAPEISERLAQFGYKRTVYAIKMRADRSLGISLALNEYGVTTLAYLLGISQGATRALHRGRDGQPKLAHRMQRSLGPHPGARTSRKDIETYLGRYPWRVRSQVIRDKGLRALVEQGQRAQPMRTLEQAARDLGVSVYRLSVWRSNGSVRRVLGQEPLLQLNGVRGSKGVWMFSPEQVEQIRAWAQRHGSLGCVSPSPCTAEGKRR